MAGIGDNQAKIEELSGKVVAFYNSIESATRTELETYCNDIYSDWMGEDEEAFEDRVAKTLTQFLANCVQIINSTTTFICESGNKWVEWHNTTAASISEGFGGGTGTLEAEQISEPEQLTGKHKGGSYDSENRGLQSDSAAGNLTSKTETMLTNIKAAIDPSDITAEAAFIGDVQSAAMNEMIAHIEEVYATMADTINKDLASDIETVSAGYTSQEGAVGDSAKEAQTAMDEAVSTTEG
jgi:hypothetical protein